MAKPRRTSPVTKLDPLAHRILGYLLTDFSAEKRTASDLHNGYVGLPLPSLLQRCIEEDHAEQVDLDLALKQLEDGKLIGTGPMEAYDNPPNSHVVVIAFFSKREYAYLTEEGYRTARDSRPGFERF
jgi:hypothetical protein